MNEAKKNLMEDAEDEGLKAVMGSKFQDKTKDAPHVTGTMKAVLDIERKNSSHLGTVADKKRPVPDGEWESVPTYAPNWMSKLKGCAKWALLLALLIGIRFYWYQTGQMEASAAIPSMVAWATIGGIKIGNVCRK